LLFLEIVFGFAVFSRIFFCKDVVRNILSIENTKIEPGVALPRARKTALPQRKS
jgi:hypothetical protein